MKNTAPFLTILVGIILLSTSCNQTDTSKRIESIKIRHNIQILIDSIAKYNQLTSSAVGYAGVKTVQWERYEKLSKLATLTELRELTHHQNPVVRCYAFDALASKKDTSVFSILTTHLKDTAQLSTFIGCIISNVITGDYFLNAVTPYDSTDVGYKLSSIQKHTIDSLLLFDKHIALTAKYNLIYDLKPQNNYYSRVKEIAINEKMPVAIWALAKYKKRSDVDFIRETFRNSAAEDYAIRSVIEMPDSSFYPKLINIFEREWKEKLYDYRKWEILYQALAQYPSTPHTLALFTRTIKTKDKFRYRTLGADLLIAITKYPNPIFEPFKKQIKLDKYSMESVNRALKETN